MASTFRRRVAFSETDASGRAHFTALLRWAEDAEHQLLDSLGIPICSSTGGWPRARVECDYRQPLQAGEEVEVAIELVEIGTSSLRWSFRIFGKEHSLAAVGQMVTVFASHSGSIPIEGGLREKLAGWLASPG